jgi:hypothetical protein
MEVFMPGSYFFLHVTSDYTWQVDDPVAWCLENVDNPFLERARERLLLSPGDPDRLIRVVVRRCGLVLIHRVSEELVTVQFWGQPAPDLRPFLKLHGLTTPEVRVALVARKTESIVFQPGSAFLYGDVVPPTFPWKLYQAKYERRDAEEADDWQTAPHTWGTLCWDRASSERAIPWAALKSIWRLGQAPSCPNCDTSLVVLRFLWVLPIMFSGIRRITRGCFGCLRQFEEGVDKDFWGWLVTHLDPDLLPTHRYTTRKYDLRCQYSARPATADDAGGDGPG